MTLRGSASSDSTSLPAVTDPAPGGRSGPAAFRFIDVFAGIGGMRAGLEMVGGECVFTIENDPHACRTYGANWGDIPALNVRDVDPCTLPPYDLLAAGFPCQPFSLAGVVKKEAMRRKELEAANEEVDAELLKRTHGFHDPVSGNLFFEIIRLIGGPWDLSPGELEREATEPEFDELERGTYDFALAEEGRALLRTSPTLHLMPPMMLLENVRNLKSHDKGRTFRVIRRRLVRSGYWVEDRVISGKHWVPQDRHRIFIVASRRDRFPEPFEFPKVPQDVHGLTEDLLEHDPAVLREHRLTPGVWAALERHRNRHQARGNGFGRGIAEFGKPTRTLSARYYKDGAEILIRLPEEMQSEGEAPVRRLTHQECAQLMGFVKPHLERDFVIPTRSKVQAYKQFGNAVIVPQVGWLADAIKRQALGEFRERMAAAATSSHSRSARESA